jgi:uncharacterized Rmd1/YagE family protein
MPSQPPPATGTTRMALRLPLGRDSFQARALLAGTGLDLAALGSTDRTGAAPLVIDLADGGLAVLFRSGAVVCFDAPPAAIEACLARIAPHVRQPFPPADRETETLDIRVDPATREAIEGNTLVLADASAEKLLLVADIMSKSVSLAHHERSIERQFERIEPFATSVDHRGRGGRAARELLQHLGAVLLAEHRVVAGARVDDSPELLWDHPELERLWARVRDEFEIRERSESLHAKLALVSRTAGTALDYLQAARSLRLEWAIVGLIVFEIAITLVQWAVGARGH